MAMRVLIIKEAFYKPIRVSETGLPLELGGGRSRIYLSFPEVGVTIFPDISEVSFWKCPVSNKHNSSIFNPPRVEGEVSEVREINLSDDHLIQMVINFSNAFEEILPILKELITKELEELLLAEQ